MNIFELFKSKVKPRGDISTPVTQSEVITLNRATIESIKHGCKCKICGRKFYPKKVVLSGTSIKPYKVCKECSTI